MVLQPVDDDGGGIGPFEAAAALALADQAEAAVREAGWWYRRYAGLMALATVVFLPAAGLLRGGTASLVVACLWSALVCGLALYARAQIAAWRGSRRLYFASFGLWTALWTAAVAVGLTVFGGRAAYWVPAGFVASAPLFISAWKSRPS